MKVVLGVSNRHVHLTKETYEKLFGNDELKVVKPLVQPEQFASDKKVTVKNGDRKIEGVRIIGPLRNYDQVEISKTDSYFLKVDPPIRESGDLKGSCSISLVTDKAEVLLDEGCILANRHIHITEEERKKYGLENVKKVKLKIGGEKGGILDDVYLKVADKSKYELHLDTDDANAFGLKTGDEIEIIKEED